MIFDATSLYPSATWEEKSVFPKLKSVFASKPHMNDFYVEAFNNQTFNQDRNESANLKTKSHIFASSCKKKVKNIENNRIRNVYIVDTLTNVDIQEIVKIGGKVLQGLEGVVYPENFKVSLFRKIIGKLFSSRQKYKDERNDLMQGLVKLIMNSSYGVQNCKDIIEFQKCKS